MKKILPLLLSVCLFAFNNAFASQLSIIYTGETYATLFPCHCPAEPAGGVSRRATKINQLRKENPNSLLLEVGNSFAGGSRDYNKQAEELDKQRTKVYFKCLSLMGYDAVMADEGFLRYGKDFLREIVQESGLEFINLSSLIFKSHIIKEINGLKIAVIGFEGYNEQFGLSKDRIDELKRLTDKLKKENINLVIVLTDQNEQDIYELTKNVEGIDCIISTVNYGTNQKQVITVGQTLLALSYWQARRLTRLNLNVEDGRIKSYSFEEIKLTPDVPDDPEVAALLAKYPEFKR
ncbi:MAG: hypothetical protein AB1629_02910 [Candidatus Omnitrophota bacterium]